MSNSLANGSNVVHQITFTTSNVESLIPPSSFENPLEIDTVVIAFQTLILFCTCAAFTLETRGVNCMDSIRVEDALSTQNYSGKQEE